MKKTFSCYSIVALVLFVGFMACVADRPVAPRSENLLGISQARDFYRGQLAERTTLSRASNQWAKYSFGEGDLIPQWESTLTRKRGEYFLMEVAVEQSHLWWAEIPSEQDAEPCMVPVLRQAGVMLEEATGEMDACVLTFIPDPKYARLYPDLHSNKLPLSMMPGLDGLLIHSRTDNCLPLIVDVVREGKIVRREMIIGDRDNRQANLERMFSLLKGIVLKREATLSRAGTNNFDMEIALDEIIVQAYGTPPKDPSNPDADNYPYSDPNDNHKPKGNWVSPTPEGGGDSGDGSPIPIDTVTVIAYKKAKEVAPFATKFLQSDMMTAWDWTRLEMAMQKLTRDCFEKYLMEQISKGNGNIPLFLIINKNLDPRGRLSTTIQGNNVTVKGMELKDLDYAALYYILMEEFFHIYQFQQNPVNYYKFGINREFEAKVLKDFYTIRDRYSRWKNTEDGREFDHDDFNRLKPENISAVGRDQFEGYKGDLKNMAITEWKGDDFFSGVDRMLQNMDYVESFKTKNSSYVKQGNIYSPSFLTSALKKLYRDSGCFK